MAPVLTNFATYPARLSFTVDDVGSSANTEAYIDTFLAPPLGPYYLRPSLRFNVAVVPSYPVVWSDVNSWYVAGDEIDSHSWSHQYYTTTGTPQGTCTLATCPNAPAMTIQYTGSGTAATLTISGNTLSTNVTGASGDDISVNLVLNPRPLRPTRRSNWLRICNQSHIMPCSKIRHSGRRTTGRSAVRIHMQRSC